jgi:hypothetical protein
VQGNAGTCVINAAMASAADANRVAKLIRRIGTHTYQVRLWEGLIVRYINVTFDGTWDSNDTRPGQLRFEDGSPTHANNGEFWTVLVQRAFLKLCGTNTSNPDSNRWTSKLNFRNHEIALHALTGKPTDDIALSNNKGTFEKMLVYLAKGQLVTVGGTGHAYALIEGLYIPSGKHLLRFYLLYNPWGNDNTHQSFAFLHGAKANDGLILIDDAAFRRNFKTIFVAG